MTTQEALKLCKHVAVSVHGRNGNNQVEIRDASGHLHWRMWEFETNFDWYLEREVNEYLRKYPETAK